MKYKDKIAALPPVRRLRAARWQRRAFSTMLPPLAVAAARNDPEKKRRLTDAYAKRFPSVEADRRTALEAGLGADAVDDLLWCRIARGFSADEYLCYGFSSKTEEERRAFFSDRESVRFSYQVNDPDAMRLFSDKSLTYEAFKDGYGREALPLRSENDLPAFEAFLARHPVFVKKPVFGSCGRGVERVVFPSCGKNAAALLRSLLAGGAVLAEEPITQHEALAAFHPHSVNTVRVVTLAGRNGVYAAYGFLKTGRSGSFTDNGASGGVMAGIDVSTGVIVTDGVDERGVRYERHPDTGAALRGVALPAWQSLTALCVSSAERVPAVRFIGWDAAYTGRGWVIVEGNAQSELIGPQATAGRGLRREITAYLKENGFATGGYRA